ncbi:MULTISPECIES: hypothetical protein [unclassified Clostridium]|uniref:hypothetical protein n=1 Tax=Clostridium TaxID=1485 RepID=UPI001C8B79B4|nr:MULTISPECIES: hypothetical protein [unclassified Clostridium]MBX9138805.1 hypothetical protein [Clostridium sp. K12(2020)]MBX9145568.1 hypothetical protein [Clostridium sp. K13]MDU4326184.1 hypothetical protein [Clostridium celatum]
MKQKCEKCGKDAIFFDVNLQLWLCEECVNKEYKSLDLEEFKQKNGEDKYNEELNNILIAMEKLCNSIRESNTKKIERQFKSTPYSRDLNELLSSITRERLSKIAEALDIKRVYKYKKQELKELILESYEKLILDKLQLLDEKALKALKKYYKNNGERIFNNISDEDGIYIDYFADIGAIFPTENNEGKKIFIMPTITEEIVKKLDDFQVRRKIKNNTKIISLYRGMVRAYGLLEEYQIIQFVKQYLNEEYDHEYLVNILRESSKYSDDYIVEGIFVFNSNIDNYVNLYNEINRKMKNKDYRKFSESELLSLAKSNWEVNNSYAKDFKRRFLNYFIMSEEEVDEFLKFLYAIVQEKSLEEILNEIKEMIQEEEAKEIGVDIIEKYVVNVPIWSKKGRSMKEVKIK